MLNEKEGSRLKEIYNSFLKSERKEFEEFISISLFNKGRNYNEFLKTINFNKTDAPVVKDSKVDRTRWNRLSELTILAEKFLAIKNLESNKFCYDQLLLNELKERNIKHFFEQRLNALIKSYSAKSVSFDKINQLFEINNLYSKNSKATRMSKKSIDTYHYSFDYRLIQFTIEIMECMIHENLYKNRNDSFSQTHRKVILDMQDFNAILIYFKKYIPEYFPLISFYHYTYKAIVNTNDTYNYYVAKKILKNDFKNVSKELKSVLYDYLIEYNISKMNSSKQTSNKELFHLVTLKLKDGMLEEEIRNDIFNSSFISYTMNALSLNKIKWAEDFIDRFGKQLPERNRDNGIFLCKAFVEYYKKNFALCKEYADMVKKINHYYYIHASELKLKSCFEMNKIDECHIIIKRLKDYIRIQKDSSELIIKYTHEFCSSFVLLIRLKDHPTPKNYLNLEYDLCKGNITGRKWIERKMKEITIAG